MDKKDHTVIIVAGPTASGKTGVAIQLAKHFNAEIISCDSRQCYKELNIGVARPSPEELAELPHHFVASHSITEDIHAAYFEKYALAKTEELFKKNKVVVMAGGTGLYIKAFCEGLDEIPETDNRTRDHIIQQYKEKGIGWLQEELEKKDPAFAKEGEMKNPQRMMRALEVVESTGWSILSFRAGKKAKRDFNIIKIGIDMEREVLYQRIGERANGMIEHGLVEEVKSLQAFKNNNALQTVGYKEVFEFLDRQISLERALELIKQHTRQYAKRQLTWFRKDKDIKWFTPDDIAGMIRNIEKFLPADV